MTALQSRHERDPRLWTADQFLEFYATRPEGERWQLVDGLAMMMTPPTRWHQKIAKNLLALLDRSLETHRPELEAYYEIGIHIPGTDDFSPIPDLLIVHRDDDFQRYAERFFLVAEVTSPSNTPEMIERKLELYRSHPDNLYCIAVDQDAVHVAREADWARTDLRSLHDLLKLPAFGFEAILADVYKGTPLAQ